ncbi:MAG: hypothetical protein H6Q30_1257 [Bacteroidetes bacterium]|nr:hypothetical protein [Bacteroidota bacterium]
MWSCVKYPLTLPTLVLLIMTGVPSLAQDRTASMQPSVARLESELTARHGEQQRPRIQRGLKQVAEFWRADDGDAVAFEAFTRENFAGDQKSLDAMFTRFEALLEQLDGHMTEIGRVFRNQTDLDLGPIMPFDEAFAGYDPSAHVNEDFFTNKLAFMVLLNFPLTTLEQRLGEGTQWSRRQWAEARLAQRFSRRIPADVNLAIAKAASEADRYISEYNIWMHHLVNEKGERLFPAGLRLLSHWNLRDQIKADYSDPKTGPAKQKMIQKVMERIVTQTIPASVVDNPRVDWNPFTNEVKQSTVKDHDLPASTATVHNDAEPDTRYAVLLETFLASRKADPYSPTAPTLIARRFNENREIPEERVKQMLIQVVSSPLVAKVAKLIEKRLGRPLEPYDIWYNGFRPRGKYTEAELDQIVAKKYPNADAYRKDMPDMLMKFGFTRERAEMLAENIVVDPARGSGHALGAGMRSAKTHLRTRVEKGGMNYKGFNIAVHEMGHNVEQTFSLNLIDHTLLQGVPNTAFTEALAFVFQGHDLELLGLSSPDPRNEAMKTLDDFWGAYEIGGVALLDMQVWHWMYEHPNATPAQLKEATLAMAQDLWNTYYAPVFKQKDVVLLGIYSHMIHSFLYLPDYPIGHLIAHQIEEKMKKAGNIGSEFERMATMGSVAPDLWMKNATGSPVGAEALLSAAEKALAAVDTGKGL